MLKQQQEITKYLYRIIDAGINIDDVFYHDISGINIFIIDEEQINDKVNNAIDFIIEDSEQYYDLENSIPYINITSMSKEDIVSSKFDTARQGIFKKFNVSIMHDKNYFENIFSDIIITSEITYVNLPKKQIQNMQDLASKGDVYRTDIYQQDIVAPEHSYLQGKNYAYAA